MIILDTCVIRSMSLDGSEAEVLRAIARTKTERVGAPWMAVEELAAQKALEYVDAHEQAAAALARLDRKSHQMEPKLAAADPEGVRKLWRTKYSEVLEVLPTSETALREGMFREANVLPPAGRKGEGAKAPKVGGRDVAIWLTAIEYARDNPDETVYFVSSNHKDFTKGGGASYPPPMDRDVEDLGERFKHLTNLGEVLALVAPQIDVEESEVRPLLAERDADFIQEMIAHLWGAAPSRGTFQVMTKAGIVEESAGWIPQGIVPDVKLQSLNDLKAYRLGSDSYFVVTARWQVTGVAIVGSRLVRAACYWDTRLLASLTPEDVRVQMLGQARPEPAEDAENVDWPHSVPTKASVARQILEAAKNEDRKPTWAEVTLSVITMLGMTPLERQEFLNDVSTQPDFTWRDENGQWNMAQAKHYTAPPSWRMEVENDSVDSWADADGAQEGGEPDSV